MDRKRVDMWVNYNNSFTSHWIPTSEKLPVKDGEYLVTTKNKYVVVGRFIVDFGWNGRLKNCVIAWAELPKPYKE